MENETAQHRAELLTCLEISLSVADEDFLEEVRGGDRSSTVRDEALRLLRVIPGIPNFAFVCRDVKETFTLSSFAWLGCGSDCLFGRIQKLGINEVSSNKGESDSNYILRQMAQCMPLSFWCEFSIVIQRQLPSGCVNHPLSKTYLLDGHDTGL